MNPIHPRSTNHRLRACGVALFLVTSHHALSSPITGDTVTGDLTVTGAAGYGNVNASGGGSFAEGLDIGPYAGRTYGEALWNWFPGAAANDGTAVFDITRSNGAYLWRDSMGTTSTNKMKLDENNVLSLYKSDGTSAPITLNPANGRISLQGTGSGIYLANSPLLTIGSDGKLQATSLTLGDYSQFKQGLLRGNPSSYNNGSSIAMSDGEVYSTSSAGATAMSKGVAYGESSTAMSGGRAFYVNSVAMTNGSSYEYSATAMSNGVAYGLFSTAMSAGSAHGYFATAMSYGVAGGHFSTAITGGITSGNYSFAAGQNALADSYSSTSLGRYNKSWGSSYNWVENDPLFLVGNGTGISSTLASNAITTLKNGQTTLTNKAWKDNVTANPTQTIADPPPAATVDSNGEALVVEGHTRLRGKVVIEQPQGDISMGIYGN
jgi:hypothetical protein